MAGQQSESTIATHPPTTTTGDATDPKKPGSDAGAGSSSAGSDADLVNQKGVFDGNAALARLKQIESIALESALPSDAVPPVTLDHGVKLANDVDSRGNKIERTANGGVIATDSTGNLSFDFDAKKGVGLFKKLTGDGSIEATRAHDPLHPGTDTYTFNRFDAEHHLISSQETIPGGVRTIIGNSAIEQLDETYEQWKAKPDQANSTEQRIIALKDRTIMALGGTDSLVADLNRHFEIHHDGQRYLFDAEGKLAQVFSKDGKFQAVTTEAQADAAAFLKAHDLHVDPLKGIVGPNGESMRLGAGNVEVKRDNWSLLVEAGKSKLTEGDGTVTAMANGLVTSRDAKGQELFNYNVATNTFKTPDITFTNQGTTLGWSNQTIGCDGAVALANGQNLDGPGSPGFMIAQVEAQNLSMMTLNLAAQCASDPSQLGALRAAINQLDACRAECIAYNNLEAAIKVDNSLALAMRCVEGGDKTTAVQNNPPQTNVNGQVIAMQSAPLNFSSSA